MKFRIALLSLLLSAVVLGTTAAHASVTHTDYSAPISETSPDPGCHQTDPVHIEGQANGHVTEVRGDFHFAVLGKGTATFAENGEHFTGRFVRTFSILLKSGETFTENTQTFTSTAVGDQGHHAVLHVTVHVTYFAATDTFAAQAFALHHSCT